MREMLIAALRLVEDAQALIEQALGADDTPALREAQEAVRVAIEAIQRALTEIA